jgi:hypothetical protein
MGIRSDRNAPHPDISQEDLRESHPQKPTSNLLKDAHFSQKDPQKADKEEPDFHNRRKGYKPVTIRPMSVRSELT